MSAASAWEVAIKQGLGKIRVSESFTAMVQASEFQPLAINLEHAEATKDLPPHHADRSTVF